MPSYSIQVNIVGFAVNFSWSRSIVWRMVEPLSMQNFRCNGTDVLLPSPKPAYRLALIWCVPSLPLFLHLCFFLCLSIPTSPLAWPLRPGAAGADGQGPLLCFQHGEQPCHPIPGLPRGGEGLDGEEHAGRSAQQADKSSFYARGPHA